MQIAIQGELGSFSHEAALRMMGSDGEQAGAPEELTIVPCTSSVDVFAALSEGKVDGAIIPIENSLAGPVAEHYDLLLENDVAIERESLLRIQHNLISLPSSSLEKIRQVSSHPVALAQCRRFFNSHPDIRPVPYYDTAGSVKQVIEAGDSTAAAIASSQAAAQYGGKILALNLEDNPANFTRFLLLRRTGRLEYDGAADKVSIAFTVENRPGTLVKALEVFAVQGANMTKIESRPVQGKPWQYVFYVDYQCSDKAAADGIFDMLKSSCWMVKELGRYKSFSGKLDC